jgi:O-antigen ligase
MRKDSWNVFRAWLRDSGWFEWVIVLLIAGFIGAWSIRFHRNFFYYLILLPFVISMTHEDWRKFFSSSIVKCLVLFLLYGILSISWSESVTISFVYDHLRYVVIIIIFTMAVAWVVSHKSFWEEKLLYVLVPVAGAVFVYSVLTYYGEHSFPAARLNNMVFYRNNPNAGSAAFVLVALMGLNAVLQKSNRLTCMLGGFGLIVGIAFLFLSQSRGLLLGMAAGTVVQLICFRYWRSLAFVFLMLAGTIIVLESFDLGMRSFIQRGDSHRIDIWLVSLQKIAANPIIGLGGAVDLSIITAESGGKVFESPHNIWLVVAMSGGIIWLGLFIVLLAVAGKEAFRSIMENNSKGCFYASLMLAGLCILSFSCHNIIENIGSHYWTTLWLPLGLIAGLELNRFNRN